MEEQMDRHRFGEIFYWGVIWMQSS